MSQIVYLVLGKVTDASAHIGGVLGQTEYQFCDGPPGDRSYSADYIDLLQGLSEHSGCVIIVVQ